MPTLITTIDECEDPIKYSFKPVWELVKSEYEVGNFTMTAEENQGRASNFQVSGLSSRVRSVNI